MHLLDVDKTSIAASLTNVLGTAVQLQLRGGREVGKKKGSPWGCWR
jgi:hypothetical protein